MFGFSIGAFTFVLLPLGFLVTLVFWLVDAAILVRWSLLVATARKPPTDRGGVPPSDRTP